MIEELAAAYEQRMTLLVLSAIVIAGMLIRALTDRRWLIVTFQILAGTEAIALLDETGATFPQLIDIELELGTREPTR